jgi:hypothetical protein
MNISYSQIVFTTSILYTRGRTIYKLHVHRGGAGPQNRDLRPKFFGNCTLTKEKGFQSLASNISVKLVQTTLTVSISLSQQLQVYGKSYFWTKFFYSLLRPKNIKLGTKKNAQQNFERARPQIS